LLCKFNAKHDHHIFNWFFNVFFGSNYIITTFVQLLAFILISTRIDGAQWSIILAWSFIDETTDVAGIIVTIIRELHEWIHVALAATTANGIHSIIDERRCFLVGPRICERLNNYAQRNLGLVCDGRFIAQCVGGGPQVAWTHIAIILRDEVIETHGRVVEWHWRRLEDLVDDTVFGLQTGPRNQFGVDAGLLAWHRRSSASLCRRRFRLLLNFLVFGRIGGIEGLLNLWLLLSELSLCLNRRLLLLNGWLGCLFGLMSDPVF
jgi:hypothetical protein